MSAEDKQPEGSSPAGSSRFSELDELQQEISRRIKDNQRFLDGFLSEEYEDDEDEKEDDSPNFEEL